jgi:hypothetical protein
MGFKEEIRANNDRFKKDIKRVGEKTRGAGKDNTPRVKRVMPTWAVITLLVFVFPIGLYVLWRQDRWSKRFKKHTTWGVTAALVLLVTLVTIFAPPTVKVKSSLASVTGDTYAMAGTVSPSGSTVTVNGIQAKVERDTYTAAVPLKEGDNQLAIVATSGSKVTRQTFKLHRYTKAENTARAQAAAQKKAAIVAAKAKAKADAATKQAKARASAAAKRAATAAATKAKHDKAAADKAKAVATAATAAAKKQATADAAAKAKADAATATAAAKIPKVLLDITGSGTKQTQAFTTKSSWAISYAFDCSNFGYRGNFQIYLHNTDGSYNYGSGPNDLAMSGGDVDYYYNDAGSHYLTINSECNWHVIVKS